MKKLIIFCSFFFALNAAAYSGQLSKIELTDGSVINGEVVSYLNNIYTISTTSFGEIKVEAAKVVKIESANYISPNTSLSPIVQTNNPTPSQVSAYGQTLMKNPENVTVLKGLASDPRVQEIAGDAQIQDAAKSGDIQALMKNPKFMDIVNSPEVQKAIKKLKQ